MKKGILMLLGFFSSIVMFSQETLSLSLDEAISYGLENSYAAKNAERDIEIAKYKNKETVAIGLPQISAAIDYQNWIKQQISLLPASIVGGEDGEFVEIAFGTPNTLSATATLSQLLFDGSYIVGLRYLDTYKQISLNAQEKTEQIVRESIINAYGNVLFTEEGISIIEKNLASLEKNLMQTKEIYKNGFAEEESVEQLEITLASLKSLLSRSKKLKGINYKMLNITLGSPIDTGLLLTDNLNSLTAKNTSLELLGSNFTIENHIDFKIAAITQEGKEAVVELEKSKALPTISSFLNFGYTGYGESFAFLSKEQRWFDSSLLGVSMNIPIFSSLSRSSRTQQAKIDLEKSKADLQETSQKVLLTLDTAKVTYQYSIEEYETSKRNLALAERIEKKQEIKFFEGLSTSFELTTAQNQLYTMQQNYLQAMLDVISAKAGLDKALSTPINN